MAVLFELVVNFGTGQDAARTAAELVRRAGHIDVRGVPVPLGEPFISELKSPAYIEFSVHPRGIGYRGPGPKPALDPRSLTSEEITGVGHALYDLLRNFSGYRAAVVGWDPEAQVDLEDLEADWRDGDPPGYDGLVLAEDLCEKWQLGPEWNAFEPATGGCPIPDRGTSRCQKRKGGQQGTRSYPRRRSAVSIATSTREVMPGTSTGRRPATWPRIHFGWLSSWCSRAYRSHHGSRVTPAIDS